MRNLRLGVILPRLDLGLMLNVVACFWYRTQAGRRDRSPTNLANSVCAQVKLGQSILDLAEIRLPIDERLISLVKPLQIHARIAAIARRVLRRVLVLGVALAFALLLTRNGSVDAVALRVEALFQFLQYLRCQLGIGVH